MLGQRPKDKSVNIEFQPGRKSVRIQPDVATAPPPASAYSARSNTLRDTLHRD